MNTKAFKNFQRFGLKLCSFLMADLSGLLSWVFLDFLDVKTKRHNSKSQRVAGSVNYARIVDIISSILGTTLAFLNKNIMFSFWVRRVRQVICFQVWFQNRRAKFRRNERSALSHKPVYTDNNNCDPSKSIEQPVLPKTTIQGQVRSGYVR